MTINSQKILIVDQQSNVRSALFRLLDKKGFQVVTAANLDEVNNLPTPCSFFHLVILDLEIPNSLNFIHSLKKQNNHVQIITLNNQENTDLAVKTTQAGATQFIVKPFQVSSFISVVENTLSQQIKKQNFIEQNQQISQKYQFNNIIGQSSELKKVLDLVERVADSDSTTLVTGESGTGKELIAKAIHYNSSRAKKPFVPINCGAIPAELLESELFGHVKGAFTGAIANRMGRFEMADQGTIFLDEIGDMSPTLQVKLLRILQEQTFEPVGSTKTVKVNVRIITATHVDLEKAVSEGRFREDLYYRLNVIPIKTPSLRERKSDIPLLLHHFMEKFNETKKRQLAGFSEAALKVLFEYKWPGNIRELENLVERLAILKGQGEIDETDLPEKYKNSKNKDAINTNNSISIPEAGMDFNSAVDEYENALILSALEKTGWNRNQAAIMLRLNRTTLVEKIKKKGLRPPETNI